MTIKSRHASFAAALKALNALESKGVLAEIRTDNRRGDWLVVLV